MHIQYARLMAVSLAAMAAGILGCGKSRGGPGGAGVLGSAASELPSGAIPIASAPTPPTPATSAPPLVLGSGQSAPLSFAPIAKHADPSVVTVNTIVEETEPDIFGRARRRVAKGLGTGFV